MSRPPRTAAAVLAVGFSLAVSFALAACGDSDSPDPASASFELTIGNLVPLRGDLAIYGPGGRRAVELAARIARQAAADANAEIGVRVVNEDTETNEQIAEIVARRLVEEESAGCLVGDWAANGTFTVGSNVAADESVPLISPASTNPEIAAIDDRGMIFRTAPSDDLQAQALARLGAAGAGTDGVLSVAARDDAYGFRFSLALADAWAAAGGRIDEPLRYDPALPQHPDEAAQIVAGDPDAYAIVDFPDGYARLAPDLLRIPEFDPARLLLPATMATDDVRDDDIAPAAVEGAQGLLPGAIAPTPAGDWFARHVPEANRFQAQAFDAAIVCFLGAVAAGSTEGSEIADQLRDISGPPGERFGPERLADAVRALRAGEDIDYDGASGPVDFDDRGDPTAGAYSVFSYRDGRMRTGRRILAER